MKKYQALDDVSCIEINQPEMNIVVNDSELPKEVLVKDAINNRPVVLAPGEGQMASNIMREENFDAKAFPLKHQSGRFGLHFKRQYRLSKQ